MWTQLPRVSIHEIKSLIAEVNKNYFKSSMIPQEFKRMFSFPYRTSKKIVILEFEPNPRSTQITLCVDDRIAAGWMYYKTHKFDLPKDAKDYLVERLNQVLLDNAYPESIKIDSLPEVEKEYTKIFAMINNVSREVSVPSIFVDEIHQNNDTIDKEINEKIRAYREEKEKVKTR